VSGLYHDYVWYLIFYDIKDADGNCLNDVPCYDQRFGRVTLFFAYVGLVMLMERSISKLGITKWLSKYLPTAVIAQFLLLIHLPIGYWWVYAYAMMVFCVLYDWPVFWTGTTAIGSSVDSLNTLRLDCVRWSGSGREHCKFMLFLELWWDAVGILHDAKTAT